eukprot:CAMPEP_0202698078 /NCGR_PEP_ID=MMETSP1385-20130828/11345_1 /ASSEMBLY_ACC=CAM_ASM_000861 /TAXON_ID=933848 /ORGANISM="Elphidium margaritaceum" /LENGTH=386 /DNA_ID=CAMNT_0049354681 /DNA_START=82 /DNA_END=1242 /DNA_ORIENTATION=-
MTVNSCPSNSCKTSPILHLSTDGYLTDIPFGSWFPSSHAHRDCSTLFTKHKCIDRGATCAVYDVTYHGRRCALKQIVRSERFGEPLFITEARCLSKLRHTSIIEYIDMWMDEQFYYLVLEKADINLRDVLLQKHNLAELQCKLIAYALLNALQYMHNKQVAHRDIKPENIVFVGRNLGAPKLIDFGDAVMCKPDKMYSEFVGTPPYMSPERLRDHNAAELQKSDIWALAAVVYEMWSGHRCFTGSSQKEVFNRVMHGTWQWCADRMPSKEMQDFVQQCLSLDVTQRLDVKQALAHDWFAEIENSKFDACTDVTDVDQDCGHGVDDDEDEEEEDAEGEVVDNEQESADPPMEEHDVMKYDFFDSLTPNMKSVVSLPILATKPKQFSN